MKTVRKQLLDEQGMILVVSLMLLALLFGAGAGAILSTQANLNISGNLKTSAQAFYLAEAGIAWAKQRIRDSDSNPVRPVGGTQALAPGRFTVDFKDPATESRLVSRIKVTSTGNVGNASSTVEALLTKAYDLTDGAMSIRGNGVNPSFVGDSFSVDGRDYDPATEALVPGGKSKFGISMPNAILAAELTSHLTGEQLDNVVGQGGTTPSIGLSRFLPSDAMERLAIDLCNHPSAVVQDVPSSGAVVISGATTWGTRAAPQIRCVLGLTTGLNAPTDVVEIGGNFSGAGLLVVRNADLVTSGAFRWEGLILISGLNVGFRVEGGGEKNVYGSVMINERSNDSAKELKLQGAVNVRYSRSALLQSTTSFSLFYDPLSAVYSYLPSSIAQLYWKAVTD